MTCNHCDFMPEATEKLQTKEGKDRLKRVEKTFNEYVQKQKDEHDYYVANKRTIVASKMEPRWAPANNHGYEFTDVISDPNYLFKKSLEPLDKTPLQTKPFNVSKFTS